MNNKTINVDCCAGPGLISVSQAIDRILEKAGSVAEHTVVRTQDSLNRILAEDTNASIDVPGYDNSAMDGYALNSSDVSERATLAVSQRIPAGSMGKPLEPGTAARIFTGAPIPEGADVVVMQEHCHAEGDRVTINTNVKPGMNVRKAGEDIASGSTIASAGKRIRPQEMGLLASIGVAEVKVKRRLKVATFFTGDEIVMPGNALKPGQIYNSNRFTITGFLTAYNCEIIDLGIVPDTLDATLQVLKEAASQADLVITSGGVSVGEEDYVRIALEQLGELSMWRIAMKPGKPVAFGKVDNALFMGLPGNPVSVFVTGLLFARPLIFKMQGDSESLTRSFMIHAGFDWKAGGRQEYLRARIDYTDDRPVATLYPHQGSGVLSSASWADGLVEVLINRDIKQGDLVPFIPFHGVL